MNQHRRGLDARPGLLASVGRYAREISSGVLAIHAAVMAYAYSQPGLAIAPPQPGRASIVAFIDSLGPYWLVGFGLAAVVLAIGSLGTSALILRIGHSLATGVVGSFDVALWLGWYYSLPPRPTIVAASFAAVVVVWHFLMAQVYTDEMPPMRRLLDDDGDEA